MRALVGLACAAAAVLGASSARADSVCCQGWLTEQFATCHGGACNLGETTIAVDVQDAGNPVCRPGSTSCLVEPEWTCCLQDCMDGQQCIATLAYRPTCCLGYCGEVGDPVSPNPKCASPAMYDACCYPDHVEVTAAEVGSPGEWTVSAGDLVPYPEASEPPPARDDASSDGNVEASDPDPSTGGSGGCTSTGSSTAPPWVALALSALSLRRRRP